VLHRIDATVCELGAGIVQMLSTDADEMPSPDESPTSAHAADASRGWWMSSWFTVQIVFERWQPEMRLELTLRGEHLRVLNVKHAVWESGPPDGKMPAAEMGGVSHLAIALRLIETEFTYKMLKAVHLRVQGRLIHWEMAKCAMERPPALPPSPHPPPSPQPMLPSPLSPPPPDFTLEYSTLAVTGSGLLGLVAWWLRRQLGGCSPAALREAFDRGRARRGATGLATSDDADNVDDLIIETTDAENVDDLVYKSRAEQHAHRPGRKTYSNEVTDVQVSDGVLD